MIFFILQILWMIPLLLFSNDFEEISLSRTQQYSMAPYRHIVVYSAPRMGSTLIYNVFRYLFETTENLLNPHYNFELSGWIHKTHNLGDVLSLAEEGILCVFLMRDPIDTSLSMYRIWELTHPEKIQDMQEWCASQIESLVAYQKNRFNTFKIMVLKF